jgi:phenylacetate-CoA ligase
VSQAALAPPYDVEEAIRRTLPGQRRHLPRLSAAARDLARFGRKEEAVLRTALRPRFAALGAQLLASPYYAEFLRARFLSPRDLAGPDDLPDFPLLDRETLRDEQERLASLPARGNGLGADLMLDRTTGSTGRPLRVLKNGYDTVHPWAVLRHLQRVAGARVPRRARVALLCGLPHGVEYDVRPPALRGGRLVRVSLARPEPARRLRGIDPHVLFTDPAGLHWLAAQEAPPRLRLALSSGLHLPPELRQRSRRRLGCPVVNYYSMTETGPLAWECLRRPGRFHVLHPDVWVESVEGELVVTRLRRSVLPLLRYRTADAGSIVAEACPCGYRGRSIVGFSGRRACLFTTPDGRSVDAWQLAWLFKHVPLSAFRLTQERPGEFLLEVPDAAAARSLRPRLRAALGLLGWTRPRLRVRAGPCTDGPGKPEPFRSHLTA